jgi:hypothetical protein
MKRQGRGRIGTRGGRLAQLVGMTGVVVSCAAGGAAASDWEKRLQELEQEGAAMTQVAQTAAVAARLWCPDAGGGAEPTA